MKEIELAKRVISWLLLEDWEIYQEVQVRPGGRIADIVAVKNGETWIIECKTSYGFQVLEQAYLWDVPRRSVAVPYVQRRPETWLRIAKEFYEVGVIEVNKYRVRSIVDPPYLERNKEWQKEMLDALTPLHKDFAQAGSNNHDHLTPYKISMMRVEEYLRSHNWGCTAAEIVEALGKLHYANEKSAKTNLVTALEKYEDWCLVDKSRSPARIYHGKL